MAGRVRPVKLPPLGETEAEIRTYLAAVAAALAAGKIATKPAQVLGTLARASLDALKHQHDRTEIIELERMRAEADAEAEDDGDVEEPADGADP
jgi:hypothetical protein